MIRRLFWWGLLLSSPARAYWAPNHIDLNRQVFLEGTPWHAGFVRGGVPIIKPVEYLRRVLYVTEPDTVPISGVGFDGSALLGGLIKPLGQDKPTDAPNRRLPPQEWNELGGLWEDGFSTLAEGTKWGGRRAVNHFHDPLSSGGGGYTGLTDVDSATGVAFVDLLRKGISVTQWVMNGVSGGGAFGANFWGYPTVGEGFHKAFTEQTRVKREAGFAAAMRSLGQVEHLVEDNTVPDHARDLPHPGDGWEEYMARLRHGLFLHTPKPWVEFPVKSIEQDGLRALWDRDVYGGPNVSITASVTDPPGLDEYTNSNFLAWNRLTSAAGVPIIPIDFTTIPATPRTGFERGWRIVPSGSLLFGLSLRTNTINYPWPQLGGLRGHDWDSEPGSLTLNPIATDFFVVPGNAISTYAWNNYEDPLMKRAHGYAQAVLSLALPPARAELISAMNGDPLQLGVRIWNLGPAGGPDAVTWHVEELTIVGVHPESGINRSSVDDAPITWSEVLDVAPGAMKESSTRTLTWKQKAALSFDTHVAVLIKAHLGDAKRTPLLFSVPIPNGYALVKQTGGLDVTPVVPHTEGNCTTGGGCGYSGEVATYRNPLHQLVNGTIEVLPTELDIFGRQADADLKKVLHDETRIAEVMLFAWPHISTKQDYVPVQAVASTLTLTGSNLKKVAPGRWVRDAMATDEPDGPIGFTADLMLSDFYVPDMGDPLIDANRASGTLYLGVTTTAGAFYPQRLVVWPLRNNQPASALLTPACKLGVPRSAQISEDRAICTIGGAAPNCSAHYARVQSIYGDFGAAATQIAMGDPLTSALPVGASNDVRPITFVGQPVPLMGDAKLPYDCNVNALLQVWPMGNGQITCSILGPSGLAFFSVSNTDTGTTCPTTGPQAIPWTATYHRFFFPGLVDALKKGFGLTTAPAEWSFDLK